MEVYAYQHIGIPRSHGVDGTPNWSGLQDAHGEWPTDEDGAGGVAVDCYLNTNAREFRGNAIITGDHRKLERQAE